MHVAQRAGHREFDDDLVIRRPGQRYIRQQSSLAKSKFPLPRDTNPRLSHLMRNAFSNTFSTTP
jgi:hypothetical protein